MITFIRNFFDKDRRLRLLLDQQYDALRSCSFCLHELRTKRRELTAIVETRAAEMTEKQLQLANEIISLCDKKIESVENRRIQIDREVQTVRLLIARRQVEALL